MENQINKFIENFSLINWTNRNKLLFLKEKLIDYGCYLAESLMDIPEEFRNYEDVEIQQRILNSIIKIINEYV